MLLSSASTDKAIHWIEHGKAWRIVRWEALRRDILPQFFPQLREEDGAAASIDGFLKHLKAWGFEEIISGPDAGAYSHEVRSQDRVLTQFSNQSCPFRRPLTTLFVLLAFFTDVLP